MSLIKHMILATKDPTTGAHIVAASVPVIANDPATHLVTLFSGTTDANGYVPITITPPQPFCLKINGVQEPDYHDIGQGEVSPLERLIVEWRGSVGHEVDIDLGYAFNEHYPGGGLYNGIGLRDRSALGKTHSPDIMWMERDGTSSVYLVTHERHENGDLHRHFSMYARSYLDNAWTKLYDIQYKRDDPLWVLNGGAFGTPNTLMLYGIRKMGAGKLWLRPPGASKVVTGTIGGGNGGIFTWSAAEGGTNIDQLSGDPVSDRGEVINFAPSGATAKVSTQTAVSLFVYAITGVIAPGDVGTGANSGATITVTSVSAGQADYLFNYLSPGTLEEYNDTRFWYSPNAAPTAWVERLRITGSTDTAQIQVKNSSLLMQAAVGAKGLFQAMNNFPLLTVTSKATGAAGYTISAAEALGGIINDIATAAGIATMPTAALMVAELTGVQVGNSFVLEYRNKAGGAFTVTLGAGVGNTLFSGDTFTIVQGEVRKFLVRFTNVTVGAEATTIYSLGNGVI